MSLLKGERIELIERDDDFGDGWYLGKHLYNGRVGLFPEGEPSWEQEQVVCMYNNNGSTKTVYTTVTPKVSNLFTATISASNALPRTGSGANLPQVQTITYDNHGLDSPNAPPHMQPYPNEAASNGDARGVRTADGATPPPPYTTPPSQRGSASFGMTLTTPNTPTAIAAQRSISISMGAVRGPGEESPVMNETLSVIDEHITDMNTPRSSLMVGDRRGTHDSGSEYSNHIDHRLSYIRGHETDEEEREPHSESEIRTWSPEQVAEGLKDIGVEPRHCEVFREQEITGEVLLAMDQASIFMKEFDLGLVGRRLRTWHKIKAFQDEVRNCKSPNNTTLNLFGADGSSDDYEPSQKRNTAHASTLSQSPSLIDQPESRQTHLQPDISSFHKLPPQNIQRHQSETNSTPGSFTFASGRNSPIRPSAASIRELNHARRHSAADFASPLTPNERGGTAFFGKTALSPHKKAPSLDRNWTMGSYNSPLNGRPFSAVASPTITSSDCNMFDPMLPEPVDSDNTQRDLDRGYVSSGGGDNKKTRKVLKKLENTSAKHSRQSSYREEPRPVSTTASRRQSRFGSVDSIRDTVASITSPASKLYHGHSIKSRFRHSSTKNDNAIISEFNSASIFNPRAVTKLEYEENPGLNIITTSPKPNDDASSNGSPQSSVRTPKSPTKSRIGLGAISDAVAGDDMVMVGSPVSPMSPVKETRTQSPTRTGSTTTSAASQNMDRESTDASSKGTGGAPGGSGLAPTKAVSRRKPKRATSAYVRGLEQKSPQEQMVGCDYNGWMKKKSSNLMTTWKSRLFVLRGRRLSYYYSESDTEEKGLIDISSHRVLPADHDFITGIHATVTGAKASPVSPSNTQSLTQAGVEAAAQPDPTTPKGNSDVIFIFKLVPPRAGLSRAVNFTKPTVHYFAVDNITQGRLWMAALMKATIDRDETKPITTTFQQKTISLVKARALRHRPPALMGRGEKTEVEDAPRSDETGLETPDIVSDADGDGPRRRRTGSLNFRGRSKVDQGKE